MLDSTYLVHSKTDKFFHHFPGVMLDDASMGFFIWFIPVVYQFLLPWSIFLVTDFDQFSHTDFGEDPLFVDGGAGAMAAIRTGHRHQDNEKEDEEDDGPVDGQS